MSNDAKPSTAAQRQRHYRHHLAARLDRIQNSLEQVAEAVQQLAAERDQRPEQEQSNAQQR